MKTFLGCLLVLSGVVLGLYVGFWLMFVGGVVDIVEAVRAEVLQTSQLGWGIGKCVFAQLVGGLSALVLCGPGVALLKE